MPSKPVRSFRPRHPIICVNEKFWQDLNFGPLQSLFMCSVTCIRSFCCSAKSPASVGEYAYNAEAIERICGPDAYAGGGKGAGLGIGA